MFVRVLSALLLLGASTLPAQSAIDLTIGVGRGIGAPGASDRTLLTLGATVARTLSTRSYGAVPLALGTQADLPLWRGYCLTLPGAPCRQFPGLAAVALLTGWSRHADLVRGPRLLVGPAYVWNEQGDADGLGAMVRADYAERLTANLAFVFTAQSVVAPAWNGSRLATLSIGAGVRASLP